MTELYQPNPYHPENLTDADLAALKKRGVLYRDNNLRVARAAELIANYLEHPDRIVHDPYDPIEVELKAKVDSEIAEAVFGLSSQGLTDLVAWLCEGSVHIDPLPE